MERFDRSPLRRILLRSDVDIGDRSGPNPPDGLISRRCNLLFRSRFIRANALKRTSTYFSYPLIYIYSLFHSSTTLAFFFHSRRVLSRVSLSLPCRNFWSDCVSASHLVHFIITASSSSSASTPLFLKMIRFNGRRKSTGRILRFIRCRN